ncbi:MAG: DUF1801 domain-containing protein [Aggregatilineales bacterium]
MAELKTQLTEKDPREFLNQIEHERKREDAFAILELMQEVTGEPAKMWGDTIIGFGTYTYQYASGRTGEWMVSGFSPRKQNLTLYIMAGFEHYDDLMSKLGKYKTGKSCLYINKLADIDQDVLRELVKQSVDHMHATNPPIE